MSAREYGEMVCSSGFVFRRREAFRTGKKLTPSQAREEIEYACANVSDHYGIETPPFPEVWERFGGEIERNGMGHYSKVTLFVFQKASCGARH